MVNVNGNSVSVEGLSEFEAKLKQLKTDNPGFERRLKGVIRKVLGEARASLRKDASSGLQMQSDPRHAYKAVRYAVYKRLFGGQVNILQSRRAGAETGYRPPRTLRPGQRGGNRKARRSRNLDKYEGVDRGFILRFLNAGTDARYSGHGRMPKSKSRDVRDKWVCDYGGSGFRGAISARNWFGQASQRELETVALKMQEFIDKIIKDEFV